MPESAAVRGTHLEHGALGVLVLLSLVVLGSFALYVMNAGEREEHVRRPLRRLHVVLLRVASRLLDWAGRFVVALRARNRWAIGSLAVLLLIAAVSLVGPTMIQPPHDMKAEVEQLASAEAHITATYDTAAAQFRLGNMTAASLAQLIDRRITPELHVIRIRLMAVERVRPEQVMLLDKAKEYMRLREESWRLRVDALQKRNMVALQRVELTERASLAALDAAVQAARVM